MDPTKCLDDLLECLECLFAGDDCHMRCREIAVERCEELATWLRNDGFPPNLATFPNYRGPFPGDKA